MSKQVFLWVFLVGFICLTAVVSAAEVRPVSETEANTSKAMSIAWAEKTVNKLDFQERCNALVRAVGGADKLILTAGENGSGSAAFDGIAQVSPEQQLVPNIQATRTMQGMLSATDSAVISRMMLLRTQMVYQNKIRYANRIQQSPGLFSFAFSPSPSGGSAGIADSNRLGIWGNGNYTTGHVDTSSSQMGFGFDNSGGNLGADYRITNNFVAGAAFSYMGTNANVNNSGSNVKSDSYTGSIFSMYTHNSGFYVDGTASYGALDYNINRHIQYTVVNPINVDTVNANATGRPSGSQYSFGGGIGYQYSIGATTIEPFARANYQGLIMQSFSESESGQGIGWGMHYNKQNISSLPTSVGLRLSQAISTRWGVFQPQINGAWIHEFQDNQRIIQTSFLGNGSNTTFNTVTQSPDRDYFTLGANLIANLRHGVSAFAGYNTILGYQDITSHRVVLGGRFEF